MPLGIVIIEWEEFQGGLVRIKHPDTPEFAVPDNIVQMLQISHNFTPGLLHISEAGFNALSFGNEELQKVIVLVLTKYEDGEDFKGIIEQLNQVVLANPDDEEALREELKRVYELSQSVFKAREAVMVKLAQEVADLKNKEVDYKNALKYLFKRERSPKKKIVYLLIINGAQTLQELGKELKMTPIRLKATLESMMEEKMIELQGNTYNLTIYYVD